MITVYNKEGVPFEMEHSIDARQALARDDFFAKPPTEADIKEKKAEVKRSAAAAKVSIIETETAGRQKLVRRKEVGK